MNEWAGPFASEANVLAAEFFWGQQYYGGCSFETISDGFFFSLCVRKLNLTSCSHFKPHCFQSFCSALIAHHIKYNEKQNSKEKRIREVWYSFGSLFFCCCCFVNADIFLRTNKSWNLNLIIASVFFCVAVLHLRQHFCKKKKNWNADTHTYWETETAIGEVKQIRVWFFFALNFVWLFPIFRLQVQKSLVVYFQFDGWDFENFPYTLKHLPLPLFVLTFDITDYIPISFLLFNLLGDGGRMANERLKWIYVHCF